MALTFLSGIRHQQCHFMASQLGSLLVTPDFGELIAIEMEEGGEWRVEGVAIHGLAGLVSHFGVRTSLRARPNRAIFDSLELRQTFGMKLGVRDEMRTGLGPYSCANTFQI
jgi:hypothetical protein